MNIHSNALIGESSPYLLQHARNPVHWYPWGEEALEKADRERKLLLISIGYSSCHWCHVMERESFGDEEVAALMNAGFVNIKVDREERPDIDQVYMTAVQMMNQQGGWPLNCIALPDGRPVWGGTYFPRAQWMDILRQVLSFYKEHPEQLIRYAGQLAGGIRLNSLFRVEADQPALRTDDLQKIVRRWIRAFDHEEGGATGAPKFPMPVQLEFLLHYGIQQGNREVLEHTELTLTKMARGGIYDQAGGGFARYAVDRYWKVPHFEKMLYDNAQLISLYSKASLVFNREIYRQVVRQTIGFIRRELRSGEGTFYCALDADSEGEEGKYYVWEKAELEGLLKDDFGLFAAYYNIRDGGEWEEGKYILHRSLEPGTFAELHGMAEADLLQKLDAWHEMLLMRRAERKTPGLDHKTITSWNSLMISALTDAYRALGDREYLHMAQKAARLILEKHLSDDGLLFRNGPGGKNRIPGYHIDYALFTEACLDLFETSMEEEWLDHAIHLKQTCMRLFHDSETGLFRFSPPEGNFPVSNTMEVQDGVIPSSNSVMAHVLFRMGHLFADREALDLSGLMTARITGRFERFPGAYANWGRLILKQTHPFYEVVVAGPSALSVSGTMMKEYLPHVMFLRTTGESTLPLLRERFSRDKTRIFVCVNNVCKKPVEDPEEAKAFYRTGMDPFTGS